MKQLIAIALALCLVACGNAQMSESEGQAWKGIFHLSTKGDQKVEARFDFEAGTGMLFMPDLIPVPLNLNSVRQQNDSICFTVGFRSGPGFCCGALKGDTLKGIMLKDGMEGSSFWMVVSGEAISLNGQPKPPADAPIIINTHSASPTELATKQLLEEVLNTYQLEPYLYTKEIMIQDSVIPHSHPVLTLNTRDTVPELVLSTFIHEQMHWYSLAKNDGAGDIMTTIKQMYPQVPTALPEGGGSEHGTYLHIVVNYLEYHALQQILGETKAHEVMEHWKNHHYTWIYATVLEDYDQLHALMEKHKIHIKP